MAPKSVVMMDMDCCDDGHGHLHIFYWIFYSFLIFPVGRFDSATASWMCTVCADGIETCEAETSLDKGSC
jgi:hypothetical protein